MKHHRAAFKTKPAPLEGLAPIRIKQVKHNSTSGRCRRLRTQIGHPASALDRQRSNRVLIRCEKSPPQITTGQHLLHPFDPVVAADADPLKHVLDALGHAGLAVAKQTARKFNQPPKR